MIARSPLGGMTKPRVFQIFGGVSKFGVFGQRGNNGVNPPTRLNHGLVLSGTSDLRTKSNRTETCFAVLNYHLGWTIPGQLNGHIPSDAYQWAELDPVPSTWSPRGCGISLVTKQLREDFREVYRSRTRLLLLLLLLLQQQMATGGELFTEYQSVFTLENSIKFFRWIHSFTSGTCWKVNTHTYKHLLGSFHLSENQL